MEFMLGSTNKAKVLAAKKVITVYMPQAEVFNADVPSGVSAQPFGDEETRRGALNRALHASRLTEGAIGIGLEGGVRMFEDQLYVCNWGAIVLPEGTSFTAGGAQIPLPKEIAQKVLDGQELGVVIDSYSRKLDIRQKEGAIGVLTAGFVKRDDLFVHVLQLLFGQLEYWKKSR